MINNMLFIFSFIESFRIYHFEGQYPYRSYQASANQFLFIDQNDKGHLSVSAGVCSQRAMLVKKSDIEMALPSFRDHS